MSKTWKGLGIYISLRRGLRLKKRRNDLHPASNSTKKQYTILYLRPPLLDLDDPLLLELDLELLPLDTPELPELLELPLETPELLRLDLELPLDISDRELRELLPRS